jgi:hypothetical protein
MTPIFFSLLSHQKGFLIKLCLSSIYVGLWEYEASRGQLPSDMGQTKDLEAIINGLLESADVNKQALAAAPYELVE